MSLSHGRYLFVHLSVWHSVAISLLELFVGPHSSASFLQKSSEKNDDDVGLSKKICTKQDAATFTEKNSVDINYLPHLAFAGTRRKSSIQLMKQISHAALDLLNCWPNHDQCDQKKCQMSIKVAQKWFHYKNDSFWHLFKNCLRMWEIWAN